MVRFRDAARRVGQRWKALLVVSAVISLVQAVVAAPLGAFLLKQFLSSSGKASIGNFEIARFLLTPFGILTLLVLGTLALGGAYMHVVAMMRLMGDPPATAGEALRGLLRGQHRVLRLGALQIAAALLVAAPLLGGSLLLVKHLWSGYDLNGLLVLKPAVFWWGVVAASVPAILLAVLLVWGVLRWLFTVSILLEDRTLWPIAALGRSAQLTRGRHLRHGRALAVWAAVAFAVSVVLPGLVAVPGAWLLARVGTSMGTALVATAVVLVLWAFMALCASWISLALFTGLVDRLYREATGRAPATAVPTAPGSAEGQPPSGSRLRAGLAGVAVLALLASLAGWLLLRTQVLEERVEITAHRMGAFGGPENTLAALRQAIVEGADWAELDVQLTSDGALVVLHDLDLVRIGGPAKPVAQATFEEVRALDVGRALGMPQREPERVPTLEEVIAAAGDAIQLNIELKPPNAAADAPLTDAVLAAVRKANLVGRCRLCSQSYEAMRRAKEAEPKLTVGFIAGAAMGDLAALQVDFLMLNASMVTGRLVREAHARGLEVHPWTVNDADDLAGLLDRGVDNVITDAPAALRTRLGELRALTAPERLLLRVRNFLAD